MYFTERSSVVDVPSVSLGRVNIFNFCEITDFYSIFYWKPILGNLHQWR